MATQKFNFNKHGIKKKNNNVYEELNKGDFNELAEFDDLNEEFFEEDDKTE